MMIKYLSLQNECVCRFLCSESSEIAVLQVQLYDFVCAGCRIKHDFMCAVLQATSEVSEPRRMDINGSGLHIMPEIILQFSHMVEELFADQNKLQESALKTLSDFKKLRVLRIAGNHFKKFPEQLMDIPSLCVLDISKNEIERLPDNVFKMEK